MLSGGTWYGTPGTTTDHDVCPIYSYYFPKHASDHTGLVDARQKASKAGNNGIQHAWTVCLWTWMCLKKE
jgi:hypothetical protein